MSGGDAQRPFSEKGFYLDEFRGRTLAIAGPGDALGRTAPVLKELAENRTRVVLLASDSDALERLTGGEPVEAAPEGTPGRVWRALSRRPHAGLLLPGPDFATRCQRAACELGVAKLVWLDAEGGLRRTDGARRSFVHHRELRKLLEEGAPFESAERRALLEQIEAALRAGLPGVNLATAEGLADELFTYAGSGTLFTRERYVEVRRLGLDDYDAAAHLIARGVAEGFLAPRSEEAIERVLGGGFGAFVDGTHLAGIGALLYHRAEGAGEISSLYTLTRYLGEGIGRELVAAILARAGDDALDYVFACTTSERVVRFFETHGFRRVAQQAVPSAKWRDYDPERRPHLICLRVDLPAPPP